MSFFGKENEPTSDSGSRPERVWEFTNRKGELEIVTAHFVRFESQHVTFWRDRPEPNIQDTLILAEINTSVLELKEVIA